MGCYNVNTKFKMTCNILKVYLLLQYFVHYSISIPLLDINAIVIRQTGLPNLDRSQILTTTRRHIPYRTPHSKIIVIWDFMAHNKQLMFPYV